MSTLISISPSRPSPAVHGRHPLEPLTAEEVQTGGRAA